MDQPEKNNPGESVVGENESRDSIVVLGDEPAMQDSVTDGVGVSEASPVGVVIDAQFQHSSGSNSAQTYGLQSSINTPDAGFASNSEQLIATKICGGDYTGSLIVSTQNESERQTDNANMVLSDEQMDATRRSEQDYVEATPSTNESQPVAVQTEAAVKPVENTTSQEPPLKRAKTEDVTTVEIQDISEKGDAHMMTESPQTEVAVDDESQMQSNQPLEAQFKNEPRQLTGAWQCYKSNQFNNYLRGCKWAPDGTCLLTNSNDNILRVFNLPQELYYEGGDRKIIPELSPVFCIKEADTVYDFSWFPIMSSTEPETACFAVTSKDTPVHLYDAFTGDLRCTYRSYNHVDEVVAAHCVEFNVDGSKLYCGFNKTIRVFDVTRPGREFQNRPTFAKEGQRGIISCIAPSPTEVGLYATGSFAKSVALYNEPTGEMVCMFEGQRGGVTQVKFSPDGTKLYSGGRKDNEILCWDMRNPGQILFTLQRTVLTNQRMYFDITSNSRHIVSGNHDGTVSVWDSHSAPVVDKIMTDPVIHPTLRFQAHSDTTNGISLHSKLPLLATASGQRHFHCPMDSDIDSDEEAITNPDTAQPDNSLRLWWI